ncbi:MAG: copper-binding protein [Casimicrobium sp.]|jgi:Cu(I)/Ag(I) efflux system protein CusF
MKVFKTPLSVLAATTMLALSVPHFAHATEASSKDGNKTEMTAAADMTDGEIRKVDKDTKKITIKHGAIKNLDMPPMTMVFQVKDAAMIETLKVGDKIRFKAVSEKGAFVIADLMPMK